MCIRNGNHRLNPKSWCRECSSSWSCATCGKRAFETARVPKNATCFDCLHELKSFQDYLVRHSLQAIYLTDAGEKTYTSTLELWSGLTKPCTGPQTVGCTEEAKEHFLQSGHVIHAAVLRWIVSILARTASTDVVHSQRRYILLRKNSAEPWDIKDYKMFMYNHVQTGMHCFYL